MECCQNKNIIKKKKCFFAQIVLQFMDVHG